MGLCTFSHWSQTPYNALRSSSAPCDPLCVTGDPSPYEHVSAFSLQSKCLQKALLEKSPRSCPEDTG